MTLTCRSLHVSRQHKNTQYTDGTQYTNYFTLYFIQIATCFYYLYNLHSTTHVCTQTAVHKRLASHIDI